jgi:replication factor C large subunit
MSLFTYKYAPTNTSQVFGQQLAVSQLKEFVINYKQKLQRAALVVGPIGCGKTSSVYALAKELKYDLLEINSSDLRNADSIKTFLDSALGQRSLFFTPKLILIDEVDNISGVKDRGCIPALIKAISKSTFPVILTANDVDDSKFKALKKACQRIDYHKLQYKTIAHCIDWVAEQESIKTEEKAVNSLARQADGDLRGGLIDFQLCATDKNFTFDDLQHLSDRKRTDSILNALMVIFKSSTVDNALHALDDVDVDLKDVSFWIDNNLPKEYTAPHALAKAYEHLSRADLFQGRIRKRQHWRFLVYMKDLMTAGISSAKDEKNTTFIKYTPTMRFLRMWQAKMKNAKKKEIAAKLAVVTHVSTKIAAEQIPYLQSIFKNSLPTGIIDELELTDDEVEWLGK